MSLFSRNAGYSLKKSTGIFFHFYRLYKRKKARLDPKVRHDIKQALEELQTALIHKQREKAYTAALRVEDLGQAHLKRNFFEQGFHLVISLAFALVVAIIVRQVWFELYEIPTGSMRPTFKEKDRLIVSKTDFGINLPLVADHLYFDPNLMKRSGIVIFTVENMDMRDPDTMYFYLFPGKKQLVKRLMGKPGDTLYFYGGLMYGFDEKGQDISNLLQYPTLDRIEHIPFIRFEGNVEAVPSSDGMGSAVLKQMNEPVAELRIGFNNQIDGKMLKASPPGVHDYYELWGFDNFAMARLLTKDQVRQFTDQNSPDLADAPLYLELRHHPSFIGAKLIRDEWGRMRPALGLSTSVIPLQEDDLRAIFNNIYTSRFVVKNGFASRYDITARSDQQNFYLPKMPGVPDGSYEYYYGKAYEIGWEGVTHELPPTHPLYHFDVQRVQMLYNLGIQIDTAFGPQAKNQRLVPSRYAYFRDGDLYLLGAPILKKDSPALIAFQDKEQLREKNAPAQVPYHAFLDNGAPLKDDGSLDMDLFQQKGLKLPPRMYLGLGDNHANSSDSRDFGFIPETNFRGAPDFIFWPPGSRFGKPNQPLYPLLTFPRLVVWTLAAIVIGLWWWYSRKHNRLPVTIE